MNTEQRQFLSLPRYPARLSAQEAAWYLGIQEHDVRILVAAKLLKPLGRPAENGPKSFATAALEELRSDVRWLDRASETITEHWRKRRGSRRNQHNAEAHHE